MPRRSAISMRAFLLRENHRPVCRICCTGRGGDIFFMPSNRRDFLSSSEDSGELTVKSDERPNTSFKQKNKYGQITFK